MKSNIFCWTSKNDHVLGVVSLNKDSTAVTESSTEELDFSFLPINVCSGFAPVNLDGITRVRLKRDIRLWWNVHFCS
jgi:hypothetical protein